MNPEKFIPQGTSLYAADVRGEVHLVIGWDRPDEIFDEPGQFFWHPVVAKLSPPDAGHPDDVCSEVATPFAEPLNSGDGYSFSFAATLEEARALAARWKTGNGPERSVSPE